MASTVIPPQLSALNFSDIVRNTYDSRPIPGSDELIADAWLWPIHKVVPFRMKYPVTGVEIVPQRWQGDIDREKAARAEGG